MKEIAQQQCHDGSKHMGQNSLGLGSTFAAWRHESQTSNARSGVDLERSVVTFLSSKLFNARVQNLSIR